MRKIFRYFKSSMIVALIVVLMTITISYALTGVQVFSHPTSTTSAQVQNGKLNTLSTQFFTEIGLGLVSGKEAVYINGYNPSVGTSKEVIRIESAAGAYPYLTANTTLSLVSDDVDDDGDPVGTGARTILIEGLIEASGDWDEVTDTVILNGTTPVNTNIQFIRINEVRVVTAGTSGSNEGVVQLKNGATVMATINFAAGGGEGRAQLGIRSTASGTQGLLCALFMSTVGGNSSHIHTRIREFGEAFITERHFTLLDSAFGQPWTYGKLVGEKADIEIIAHATGGTSQVDAGICMYVEDIP